MNQVHPIIVRDEDVTINPEETTETTLNTTDFQINEEIQSKYEVTENLIDNPNNINTNGNIVTNYTIFVPYNNATVLNLTNNNLNGINWMNKIEEIDNNNNVLPSLKKNSISIFHIKADFDEKNPEIIIKPVYHIPNPFKVINDYIQSIKNGVSNNLHNSNNNIYPQNVNKVFVVPNLIAGPVVLFNKLQRKTTATADRLKEALFGK